MKKILSVSSVSRQFFLFEQGNIEVLNSLGYEVHCAANYSDYNERLDVLNIVQKPFDIQRSPFSLKNIRAYKQLKRMIEDGGYNIVHCHSPIGGVLARLAARKSRKNGNVKVIYTAHGFHFFKGASWVNWMIYYPIEQLLSYFTDVIITINREDYAIASKKMQAKKVELLPGIGVNVRRFADIKVDRTLKKREINIPGDAKVLLSIGELSKRKNQEVILHAMSQIDRTDIHLCIAGVGTLQNDLVELSKKLGIENRVHFLGYRSDIDELCKIADVFVFPSLQEGLPVALMEAMASGVPVVCSEIRGNTDLIEDGQGGFLCGAKDVKDFAMKISTILDDEALQEKMRKINIEMVKKCDVENINEEMKRIYLECENE